MLFCPAKHPPCCARCAPPSLRSAMVGDKKSDPAHPVDWWRAKSNRGMALDADGRWDYLPPKPSSAAGAAAGAGAAAAAAPANSPAEEMPKVKVQP